MPSDAQALHCRGLAMLQRVRDTMRAMGYSSAKSINREWTAP
jgi:hypothetical protein